MEGNTERIRILVNSADPQHCLIGHDSLGNPGLLRRSNQLGTPVMRHIKDGTTLFA